ncbi:MAG: class I SAM-dependent methyltransferase [Prolixibacteraceae bacterium]|nr:class I SAM-dependent methyltransferase [Prolixibacteraceae bacterium]MBN2650367.1 class I SAM-dependent methyltransferase [Prolixibacteraceae bacterium]
MQSLEESVVKAMDGSDNELFGHLPYMLQDIWEFGADPDAMIQLIEKHCTKYHKLKILDLGCGKGAVSIKTANNFKCTCYGIDAVGEFIEVAKQKAAQWNVGHLCTFETADIRTKIDTLSDFDVVILGAIGPVFGDYFATLSALSKCISQNGIILIDDGVIDDSSNFSHPMMYKKSEIMNQAQKAGMQMIDFDDIDKNEIEESDDYIFNKLKNRCEELMIKNPQKKHLFENYLKQQEIENDVLENKVLGATMVFKKQE